MRSMSLSVGRLVGSIVSMARRSWATPLSLGEPSRRHGSCVKIWPDRKAANSGELGVGSSQGVPAGG